MSNKKSKLDQIDLREKNGSAIFWKIADHKGLSFYANDHGNHKDYRRALRSGTRVEVRDSGTDCCTSGVVHASRYLYDAYEYAEMSGGSRTDWTYFLVRGTPVDVRSDKCGFKSLKVLYEFRDYTEASAFARRIGQSSRPFYY